MHFPLTVFVIVTDGFRNLSERIRKTLRRFFYLYAVYYKYFRYYTLSNSVTLPLIYFRFNYVTVFACISVTIIVSVNGMDVFPLTDIFVTVIINGKNADTHTHTHMSASIVVI